MLNKISCQLLCANGYNWVLVECKMSSPYINPSSRIPALTANFRAFLLNNFLLKSRYAGIVKVWHFALSVIGSGCCMNTRNPVLITFSIHRFVSSPLRTPPPASTFSTPSHPKPSHRCSSQCFHPPARPPPLARSLARPCTCACACAWLSDGKVSLGWTTHTSTHKQWAEEEEEEERSVAYLVITVPFCHLGDSDGLHFQMARPSWRGDFCNPIGRNYDGMRLLCGGSITRIIKHLAFLEKLSINVCW